MGMTAQAKVFRQGQYVFREGDKPTSIFLLRKGIISIRRMKDGGAIEIARLQQGEVLGEMSFFDRQPRSAAAMALTDVELMEIDFEALDKIYLGVPDYMKTIIASIVDRVRKANDTIRRLQKNIVPEGLPNGGDADAFSSLSVIQAAKDIPLFDNSTPVAKAEEAAKKDSGDGKK